MINAARRSRTQFGHPITYSLTMTKTEQPDIVWDRVKKRFKAYLTLHGQRELLGYFQTPEDAAMARTQSARMYVDSFLQDGGKTDA